jgi:hypothetical protein
MKVRRGALRYSILSGVPATILPSPEATWSVTMQATALAAIVLGIHAFVIMFNIFGLVAVPLGAWLRWRFVRIAWWRVLHLVSLLIVAAQAVFGQACFLTLWQAALEPDGAAAPPPMIYAWVNSLIYWPLPLWVFTVLYLVVLAYAVALWWLVPPRRAH